MNTPRPWLQANPTAPEARLLSKVAGEALPTDALQRAARRMGVSAGALHVASASLAHATAASATSAAGAAAKATASFALWGVLGKATAVGLCIGTIGVLAVQHESSPASVVATGTFASVPLLHASHLAPLPPAPSDIPAQPPRVPTLNRSERVQLPVQAASHTGSAASVVEPTAEPTAESRTAFSDLPEPPLVASAIGPHRPGLEAESRELPTPAPSSLLVHEIRALDAVRQALAERDGAGALALLENAQRTWGFERLGREAAVLRVEALGMTGRSADAQRLAHTLLQQGGVSPTQKKLLERWLRRPEQ